MQRLWQIGHSERTEFLMAADGEDRPRTRASGRRSILSSRASAADRALRRVAAASRL
jgi:hypothetical protein